MCKRAHLSVNEYFQRIETVKYLWKSKFFRVQYVHCKILALLIKFQTAEIFFTDTRRTLETVYISNTQ